MPLEDVIQQLRSARVRAGACTAPRDLARAVAQYQQTVENVFQEITNEIINIINTGGGATTPVYIIRALVDKTGGVTSADTTFNFDGASDVFTHSGFPSGITSGVAQNVELRNFQDNEVVILTSFGSDIWLADKIERDVNVIRANVDGAVTTASGTFAFDNATVLLGFGPTGGTGTAINEPRVALGDDEVVVLFQAQDGSWQLLQDDDDLGGGGGGTDPDPEEDEPIKIGFAMIIATVAPIDHFDSGTTEIIPSFAGDAAIMLTPVLANNALGFILAPETTPDPQNPEILVPVIRTAINLSRSTLRASSGVPVIMPGYVITVEGVEGPGVFAIGNWDMTSMQGFEKGSHSPEAPFMQIPFHLGGTYDFGLGGQPCPPPEIEVP